MIESVQDFGTEVHGFFLREKQNVWSALQDRVILLSFFIARCVKCLPCFGN